VFSYPVSAEQAREWIPLAPDELIYLTWVGRDVFRLAYLDLGGGHVFFALGDTSHLGDRWSQLIQQMRDLLGRCTDWATYGLVKRASSTYTIMTDQSLREDWVEMPHRREYAHPQQLRRLEDRLVQDAFGLQMLSAGHRDRLPITPDWRITELGNDCVLVEHRNLDAWYAQAKPSLKVLQSARRDFHALLIKDEHALEVRRP
jgi:hypothetical protein